MAISAYLGTSDTFDGAIADFAETYADVNARDHAAYLAAIEAGRVSMPAGGRAAPRPGAAPVDEGARQARRARRPTGTSRSSRRS